MAGKRNKIWHNRDRILTSTGGVQQDTMLITGVDYPKGCTLLRMIIDTWWTPVTTDTDISCHLAIYSGRGVSTKDIRNDNDESWLLWQFMLLHLATTIDKGTTDRFQRKSWDLGASRLARTDEEDIHVRLHAQTGQTVNCYMSARLLCLEP